jgi:hypothetical protein
MPITNPRMRQLPRAASHGIRTGCMQSISVANDPKLTWMSARPSIYLHWSFARLTVANGFRREGHMPETEMNNVFYAIALSAVILITWQYFFATSFPGKPAAPKTSPVHVLAPGIETIRPQTPSLGVQTATISGTQRSRPPSRQEALARSQRVAIDTPRLRGSIALTGGRIDDLSLARYRETTDPKSPAIERRSGASRDRIASGWGAR